MKTNESGAGFGAIGKERSKLLTAMAVLISLAACFALVTDGSADADEVTVESINASQFLAMAESGVITLDKDYILTEQVVPTSSLTIDLNGFTIDAQNHMFMNMGALGNDNVLTLKDSSEGKTGLVKNTTAVLIGFYQSLNGGGLSIESGTYYSDYCVILFSPIGDVLQAECNITGGTFKTDGTGTGLWLGNQGVAKVTVSDATFIGEDQGIPVCLGSNTDATIKNTTITSEYATALEIKAGDVVMEGCTISSSIYSFSTDVNHNGSGGAEATVSINNAYCGSARNTEVNVTITSTIITNTSNAEGATPFIIVGDKDYTYPITVTCDDYSVSQVTCGFNEQSQAVISFNGYTMVDTDARLGSVMKDGANIALAADITSSITVVSGDTVKLNLNGHRLTNTAGNHTIVNNGVLTVEDTSTDRTGVVDNVTHAKAAVFASVGSTTNLVSGTYMRSAEAGVNSSNNGGNSYYTIQNQGSMIVGDVVVKNDGRYSSCFANGWQTGVSAPMDGNGKRVTANLTINGGAFYGGLNTIKNDDLGVLTITSGTFDNYAQHALLNAHIATIRGGQFLSETEYSLFSWGADPDDGVNKYIGDGIMIIAGGQFSGGIWMSADSTLSTEGEVAMVPGNSILLEGGAIFCGTVSCEGSVLEGYFKASKDVSITAGSISINGVPAVADEDGYIKVSGPKIVISGSLEEDTNIIIVPYIDENNEEKKTNVIWKDFIEPDESKVQYQDSDGNPADSNNVANQIFDNATIGTVTINTQLDGLVYNGEAQNPPQINVSVTGTMVTVSGFLMLASEPNMPGSFQIGNDWYLWATDIKDAQIWQNGTAVTEAKDAGVYTVRFGYAAGGTYYVVDCSWIIERAELTINVDSENVYDGEDFAYDITGDNVIGLVAGDSITGGTITTVGSDVKDYTAEGSDWIIDGLSTLNGIANYDVVIGSVFLEITPRLITISVNESKVYDGNEFNYNIESDDVDNLVLGDSISGTLTTSGSDAGVYIHDVSTEAVVPVITISNGNDNYEISYDVILTISKKMLNVESIAVDEKTYDGTISATITSVTFTDYVGSDSELVMDTDFTVTGSFRDADAGDDKEVDVTITPVDGSANLKNYTIPTTYVATGTISKATLTLSDAELEEKVYNGSPKWDSVSSVTFADSDDNAVTLDSDDYQVSAATADGTADAGTSPDYTKAATVTVTLNADLNYAFVDGLVATYEVSDAVLKPLEVTSDMVRISKLSVDGKFFAEISVVSGELRLDTFTASVTGPNEGSAVESDGRYELTETGTYKFTVSSMTDTNWFVPEGGVTLTVDVQLYEVRFHTRTTVGGEYEQEQVVYGSSVMTPMASNVPEGYVLKGWSTEDKTCMYSPQVYIAVPATGLDLYAVYEERSAGVTPTPGDKPTVSISLPGSFTVGNSAIFSVTTTKGDYVGNVIGTGSFSGKAGDYSIWYWGGDYYANIGGWVEWTEGNFGGDSGFPMSDAMTHFMVVFHNAGQYSLTIKMESVNGNEVVCQDSAIITVEPRATELSPSLDVTVPSTVYAGEEFEFYVTTLGSYDFAVRGKYVGTGSGFDIKYIDEDGGLWPLDDGFFGPAGGFTYQAGATSAFKATFIETGTCTFTISIFDVESLAEVCSKVVYITVLASPSEEVPEPEVYTVTLKVDNSTSTVKVSAGDYLVLVTPEKKGYVFDGWYVEGDTGETYRYYYTPTADVTLVASFTSIPGEDEAVYTVEVQGETYTGLKAGDVITLPTATVEEDYRHIGWKTENGVILTGQQYYVVPADDANNDGKITLVSESEKYVFTVSIECGTGGSSSVGSIKVMMGGNAVISGLVPNDGYRVESVTADSGSVVDFNGTYVIFGVTSDMTVTVSFAIDLGSKDVTMTAELTEGGVVVHMSSNDGQNLIAGKIQVVYSYTEYDAELGISITKHGSSEVDYESVGQNSTSKTIVIEFPTTSSYAYVKYVVDEEVRSQTGYFATTLES